MEVVQASIKGLKEWRMHRRTNRRPNKQDRAKKPWLFPRGRLRDRRRGNEDTLLGQEPQPFLRLDKGLQGGSEDLQRSKDWVSERRDI